MIELTLDMVRGDTRLYECLLLDSDAEPYDLTGCDLTFTAKSSIADADDDAVFQLTLGAGITAPEPTTGLFTIEVSPADTVNLANATTLVCDIQLKAADDRVYTIAKGLMTIVEDVTRDYA